MIRGESMVAQAMGYINAGTIEAYLNGGRGMSVYGASVLTQMTYLLDYPGYIVTAVAVLIIIADIVLRMQRKAPESS
jgi:hypothetical protein